MRKKRNEGASIMDLPEQIMTEILLHLPIRKIVMFKATCKTWHRLISSTHFANLHYAHAKECILIRHKGYTEMARMLYLIEPSKIDSSYCRCDLIETAQPVNMKLDTKLKIPLCNDEMLLNNNDNAEEDASGEGITKRKPTIKLNSVKHHEFNIVNSCNGFLCLTTESKLTVICNPVTNEYIELPANTAISHSSAQSFLGFCQETKQYKVLRLLTLSEKKLAQCPIEGTEFYSYYVVEVLTLGSNSWKSIGYPPSFIRSAFCHMHLNGVLYWVNREYWTAPGLSFGLSSESFKSLQLPRIDPYKQISMGAIRGSLSLCVASIGSVDIWLMENCGIPESWMKLVSINAHTSTICSTPFQLASCSKCEAFVLFRCVYKTVYFYDPKSGECRSLKIRKSRMEAESIVHTPSFFSLKDVVPGANIMSISTRFKLPGETRPPYLREEA